MLRECENHGYFRDEVCPICGEPGKFLMNDTELERLGRTLAGILRHFPERFDLNMDDQGFVDLRELVNAIRNSNNRMHWLRPHHIVALVETDGKGRYQIFHDAVRATYGHSIPLELRLPTDDIPATLFYPATPEEAELILEMGLMPTDRKMVHLSLTYDDAHSAGSVRVEDPVILAIDTVATVEAGFEIGRAGKTVFLCRQVPPECLSVAEEE
jgi:putative RNA 2'-phosphotransferase